MASDLTAAEAFAVKQFIDICSNLGTSCTAAARSSSSVSSSHVSPATAIQFLHARKFDVKRAVELYEDHIRIRSSENLYCIIPDVEPLLSELQTGKFTILPSRDESGAAIALFTACKHSPLTVTHTTTLQGVVYQLDCALQNIETQKAGLIFIYDMTGSKYSNFDYELSQKILTLLKGGYPARLKKVLIVTAPLWFKAPFKILRLFVREKLRERVFTVSVPTLSLHVPHKALPRHLGGTLVIDHAAWLQHCRKSMTNREDELLANIETTAIAGAAAAAGVGIGEGISSDVINVNNHIPIVGGVAIGIDATNSIITNSDCLHLQIDGTETNENNLTGGKSPLHAIQNSNSNDCTELTTTKTNNTSTTTTGTETAATAINNAQNNQQQTLVLNGVGGVALSEFWTENPPSSASSGFSDDDSLAGQEGDPKTIEQIVQMVKELGRPGLIKEYADIRNRPPEGTFNHARMRANQSKNRYTDVLCYDHSRVVLSREETDECSDYINANFVDGYKQKNAYISTQGPLPKTSRDFWRMIWEQHCLLIVMTTRVNERGRVKCGQYWAPTENSSLDFVGFEVRTISVETNEDYTVASLELKNTKTDELRNVSHWQFTSWPDYGVPSTAMAMINFLKKVRAEQARMVKALGDTWAGHHRGPPIVVHCSAGIGRTGTFITLDICISRLEDVGTADIRGTVEKIRSQRAYSIQMPDQYVFCHLALIEYALSAGMLKSADLAGFDDREEESE